MICPSILSADFSSLKETLKEMKASEIKVVHFDVMDNHFVPNLTFGYKFIKDLRTHSDLCFDVHLMIDKPENEIEHYLDAGADVLTVHYEASEPKFLEEMSQKVRENGKKFGVSIKPNTPVSVLKNYLKYLDLILIMSVEPGFGGQKIIPSCVEKVFETRKLRNENGFEKIIIQVDGGITKENFPSVLEKGADWLVMGSAFFKESSFLTLPRLFEKVIKER